MNIYTNEYGQVIGELYWDDLSEETQKQIMELLGDNGNWDVIPFAEIVIKEEEE